MSTPTTNNPAFDPNIVSTYTGQKWNDLDARIREAAAMLGYDEDAWNSGKVTHLLKDATWNDLDAPKRDAAKLIGYDDAKWNRIYASFHSAA